MDTRKKVSLKKVKTARNFLQDLLDEYSEDLSNRYIHAISDTRSLLKDIQEDLEEIHKG